MKKTFLFFMFVLISSLVTGNLYADNDNCSWRGSGSHANCKGQIDTKWIDVSGPSHLVEIKISVPSADAVVGVTGPYASPTWYRSGNSEITVILNTGMLDPNEGWMEIAVNGGYYHAKLIYKK